MTRKFAVPVDATNPGQYLACCGLLEVMNQLDPQTEAWFGELEFNVATTVGFSDVLESLRRTSVENTMSDAQRSRLVDLSAMSKKDREGTGGADEEKKQLESLRRESPIVLTGGMSLLIDWFADDLSGGSRFKTWAGQQSVLEITRAMHSAFSKAAISTPTGLWSSARSTGLPFYFDSDLGAQGSALDVGFSFDPLNARNATRLRRASRPALEILAFIGLQRFRPRESRRNRFVYVAWPTPLPAPVAPAAACGAFLCSRAQAYQFGMLYRTDYVKSFLPAIPFQGDSDE